MVSVLFVCLGNICRSPSAHGVFLERVQRAGLSDSIEVDSCGTGAWHVGEPPDGRASAAAARRGYDLSALRARAFHVRDFERYDYILAMDALNLAELESQRPAAYTGELRRLLDYPGGPGGDVPDPYYGGDRGFEHVLDLIEAASDDLLEDVRRALAAR